MHRQWLRFGLLVGTLVIASGNTLLAQPPVVRVVTVTPLVGNVIASGNRLWNRLAAITAPSATNPYVLKVPAGVYHIGNRTLPLRSFVDVEGAGQGATYIVSTASSNGTVAGANDSELRHVTVVNLGATHAVAIRNLADTFSLANVRAMATGGSLSSTAIQNNGLSTRMRSIQAQAIGASVTGIFSRGGTMKDVMAIAQGTGITYAVFNGSSEGELDDVIASATSSGAFAGALRNEAGSPTLRNLLLTAHGVIGDGIVNGAGSQARIFDAVIHAVGVTDFANGIRNEFSSALVSGAEIRVESSGASAYGISNFFNGEPTISNVRVTVEAGGGGIGVLGDGTTLTRIERSTIVADGVAIDARDATSTIHVGASRLESGRSGAGAFRSVVSYDGTFFELGQDCLPLP
jgi:hypothetical protein